MITKQSAKAAALVLSLTVIEMGQTQAFQGGANEGREIYQQRCSHCHGVDGRGNNGMAADFRGEWHRLTKSDADLTRNLRQGFSTPGRTYLAGMCPPQVLSDREIADVLSYLRTTFTP